VKRSLDKIPEGIKIKEVILYAEYYSSDVIEELEGRGIPWPIAADKDRRIKELIKRIPEDE
jgi:hypothetical protein